jgi:redox-sensitive bicupin YhaK (pirin superfamily)
MDEGVTMSDDPVVISEARAGHVGELAVRRSLPAHRRRTVGAWCFLDHMGPATYRAGARYDVAPHPHIGLQTVTWLFEGAMVHRDSLGSEQAIRPGQLNLMTAGDGIAHSEENPGLTAGELHGVQLWVALPSNIRDGPPAFEHYDALPVLEIARGEVTVLLGAMAGVASPAGIFNEIVGAELRLGPGATALPLTASFEHALVVTEGSLEVEGRRLEPGRLAYLGAGRDELPLRASERTTAILVGGAPFEEAIVMWWNFVARSQGEISDAYESWLKRDERFGDVGSALARVEVAAPPWRAPRR